nr:MAG TPA: hypothetical protein [Caudoviricetes sp.]
MGVCPPPGSHVGMAHVLLSLSPYIIPPCGRATCLGTHITLPPRGVCWNVILVTWHTKRVMARDCLNDTSVLAKIFSR